MYLEYPAIVLQSGKLCRSDNIFQQIRSITEIN